MPTLRGPMFNGNPARVIDAAVREIEEVVGREAESMVQQRLRSVLRHPTGKYQRRVRVTVENGRAVVSDQRSVYGPWLEGTGSRNKRTRFKGYATFRKVKQELDGRALKLAETVVARYVGRLR